MRAAITALLCGFFCAVACAQESAEQPPSSDPETTQPFAQAQKTPTGEISSIHPEWRSHRSSLPDAPKPQLDDPERTPYPEGEFKPCALLGGRRAYSIAMPLNGFLIYLSARQKRGATATPRSPLCICLPRFISTLDGLHIPRRRLVLSGCGR